MPPIGDAPSLGYTSIPQSKACSSATPNVIDIRGRKLDAVVSSFATATGLEEAGLRAVHDAQGVKIVVPSSSSAVPTMWMRIKAALSNLPLLGRSATLRAARLEVDSKPLDTEGMNELVSAVEREEKSVEQDQGIELNGYYTGWARRKLTGKPLTKRRVEHVLGSALRGISQQAAGARLDRIKAQIPGGPSRVGAKTRPAQMRRNAGADRDQPELTRAQQLALRGTPVAPAAHDAQPPAIRDKSSQKSPEAPVGLLRVCTEFVRRELGLSDANALAGKSQKLFDDVRGYLIRHDRWPIEDLESFEAQFPLLVEHAGLLKTNE